MCTSTRVDAEALRAQLATVIELYTGGPLSGMGTTVLLVSLPQVGGGGGGGGVVLEPVYSSTFGEPVPASVTLFLLPALTSASRTCCGVADGLVARYSAAAPTTCGVAIEVPLMVLVAVVLPIYDEGMLLRGAKMARQ